MAPAIVHTRNIAALEAQVPAWLAGVPVRIHGEHGRDVDELHAKQARYRLLRQLYRPFVRHHVALSRELADYLRSAVGVPEASLTELCNGVDTTRFRPTPGGPAPIVDCPIDTARFFVVGTVGRMQEVKDQLLLTRAFVRALGIAPALRAWLRLVLVGDGPLRAQCDAVLAHAGVRNLAWLPGERTDVPDVLRGFSLFVLPSRAEGISNTILEAMASGLPVVATEVGGNSDLVDRGVSGELVPAGDAEALAQQIVAMAQNPQRAHQMGEAGRERVEQRFSLQRMVDAYAGLYERQLELVS
jgi:sugar transferase (PEP-CTERM/EpsH1 system associated)